MRNMAEDEGFKPPIPGRGYTGFRVQRIRSLCQSSFYIVRCKSNTFFASDKILLLFFNYINPAL